MNALPTPFAPARAEVAHAGADAAEVFDRLRRHLSPKLALTGSFAGRGAVETAALGPRVTLSDGRTALDFGSYAVTLLGHRHPAVVAAVRQQLETMPAATRSLANPVAAQAAACLAGYLGDRLRRSTSGSTAPTSSRSPSSSPASPPAATGCSR